MIQYDARIYLQERILLQSLILVHVEISNLILNCRTKKTRNKKFS